MAARAFLFLTTWAIAISVAREDADRLIIWNVGQGLWATVISGDQCWHLDMGGEHAPWQKIMRVCRERENRVHFSHWDMDHISFAPSASRFLPDLCRLNLPPLPAHPRKVKMLSRLEPCARHHQPLAEWIPTRASSSNDASAVVRWGPVLVPGDSSKAAEKNWIQRLAGLDRTEILVLGHHGSRTSTSRQLLSVLPNLKMAVASARYRRYGHPHREVVRLLGEYQIPVLSTEDWGSIVVWLKP